MPDALLFTAVAMSLVLDAGFCGLLLSVMT